MTMDLRRAEDFSERVFSTGTSLYLYKPVFLPDQSNIKFGNLVFEHRLSRTKPLLPLSRYFFRLVQSAF
jgi:hypothetical protein